MVETKDNVLVGQRSLAGRILFSFFVSKYSDFHIMLDSLMMTFKTIARILIISPFESIECSDWWGAVSLICHFDGGSLIFYADAVSLICHFDDGSLIFYAVTI
jgi:hypothetical protein